jgi:hypothetical protein
VSSPSRDDNSGDGRDVYGIGELFVDEGPESISSSSTISEIFPISSATCISSTRFGLLIALRRLRRGVGFFSIKSRFLETAIETLLWN